MKRLLENEYSEILSSNGGDKVKADCLVVPEPSAEGEITVDDFLQKYLSGELSVLVIPKEYYMQYNDLVFELLRGGMNTDDIYNGIRLFEGIEENRELIPYLVTPMAEDSYLSYLEYHVADHCNLNCKYCTHYSPLVEKPVFTDFDKFKKDINQLKKYIKDIGVIRILGGEPLLNPELPRFIELSREVYRGSLITVVTNAMLLDRISDELKDAMRKNKAFFHISFYPPLEKKIGEIKKMLVDEKIPFTITDMIPEFNKTQTIKPNGNPDFFYECFQAGCTCLHDGKLAPCYAPFTTKYFNEKYGKSLPTDEGIDLYSDELTVEKIKLGLLVPMARCSFCIAGEPHKWESVGKKSTL
ncbi:MAG: radical SAM protein, partial [Lachnospiraceae bacterium]|nr:radical SAM protein [Lachnospiraceae bacterium]